MSLLLRNQRVRETKLAFNIGSAGSRDPWTCQRISPHRSHNTENKNLGGQGEGSRFITRHQNQTHTHSHTHRTIPSPGITHTHTPHSHAPDTHTPHPRTRTDMPVSGENPLQRRTTHRLNKIHRSNSKYTNKNTHQSGSKHGRNRQPVSIDARTPRSEQHEKKKREKVRKSRIRQLTFL